MAGGREFESGKFKELVLLLAWKSKADPLISRVKLNKLLYRADFEAFRLLGKSITGARYIRGEHGPMAEQLPGAEIELGKSGLLSWRQEEVGPYAQKVPVALEVPDETQFSKAELAIVDAALAELAEHGGRAAREWSHKHSAGWRLVGDREEIPYETVIIASEPAPRKTLERLRQRVLSGDWK